MGYLDSNSIYESFCLSVLVPLCYCVGISAVEISSMGKSRSESDDDFDGTCIIYILDAFLCWYIKHDSRTTYFNDIYACL